MTNTSDEKLAKLRKLLALADGNANEAEAMAAMAKAVDYAAAFGMSMDEVRKALNDTAAAGDAGGAGFGATGPKFSGENRNSLPDWKRWSPADWFLWKDLAKFCSLKVGVASETDAATGLQYNQLNWYGHETDRELHSYLRKLINRTMSLEWLAYDRYMSSFANDTVVDTGSSRAKEWAMLSPGQKEDQQRQFYQGMADRLRERMRQMLDTMTADHAKGNTSLVVLKYNLTAARARADGFVEHHGVAGRSRFAGQTYAQGKQAGNNMNFGRGVEQGRAAAQAATTKAIGRM